MVSERPDKHASTRVNIRSLGNRLHATGGAMKFPALTATCGGGYVVVILPLPVAVFAAALPVAVLCSCSLKLLFLWLFFVAGGLVAVN